MACIIPPRLWLAALLTCLLASTASAQGPAYVYRYDSTFWIGAHLARHPEVEKTELHVKKRRRASGESILSMPVAYIWERSLGSTSGHAARGSTAGGYQEALETW